MGEYLKKLTVASAISLLSLGTIEVNKASSAVLYLGQYGFRNNSKQFFDSSQQFTTKNLPIVRRNSLLDQTASTHNTTSTKKIDNTLDKNTTSTDFSSVSQNSSQNNIDSAIKDKLLKQQLEAQLDNLPQVEQLNQQIQSNYQVFLDDPEIATQNSEQIQSSLINEFDKYTDPNAINQDIQNRYQGIVAPETEQLNLFNARKLIMSEDNPLGAEFNSGGLNSAQMEESLALLQSQGLMNAIPTQQRETKFPLPLVVAIGLLISWRGYYIVMPFLKSLWYSIDQSIIEKLRDKYGNPKVPESAASLHEKTFREVRKLAFKAEKIASEKFGSEEFKLYIRLKQEINRGLKEYRKIGKSIKLLEVAIAAQSSFLKIEATESRFYSTKQQEFYNFVADNLEEDVDKDELRNKLKQKLTEITPCLNSEEGIAALESYLEEVNTISQHSLGLNLLASFKKSQLADFTVLRTLSDIIKQIDSKDLFNHTSLIPLILEYLETFEKLAPIIQISQNESSPETYALIMQYMGLDHRQKTAYDDFELLLQILRKWQKAYKSLLTIRNEYPVKEYRLPSDFKQDIPGITIFEKYEKDL